MTEQSIVGLLVTFAYGMGAALVLLVVGIVAVFWMLRYRDNILDIDFKNQILDILKGNPVALSIWLAAWVIGAFIYAGSVASRFI